MTTSVKTATYLRGPILSPPKQISVQLLLYKTTTFFVSQMEQNLSKTATTKLHPAKKWETSIRRQGIKINLSLIIFTLLLLCIARLV